MLLVLPRAPLKYAIVLSDNTIIICFFYMCHVFFVKTGTVADCSAGDNVTMVARFPASEVSICVHILYGLV